MIKTIGIQGHKQLSIPLSGLTPVQVNGKYSTHGPSLAIIAEHIFCKTDPSNNQFIMRNTFFKPIRTLISQVVFILLFTGLNPALWAGDANLAGTWKASFTTANGQTIESTLKLKQEGDKVSGVVIGRNGNERPVDEVSFKDDQLSLKLVRERNGEKVTTKVSAKLMDDILKGKIESDYGGENRTMDWEAKRVKEAGETASSSPAGVTGNWKYDITLESGDVLNLLLNLKQDGDKVAGKVSLGDFEAPITEGKVTGNAISFKIPVDRDGAKFTSKYNGTLAGDRIKGKIQSDYGGQAHDYDWNATREKATSATAAGTWKWVIVTENGDSHDLTLKLKQDGEKLSGVVILGENEVPISDGLLKDNEITLKVSREQDGQKQVSKFKGTLEGDSIKGNIDSDWSGEMRKYAWNAKRSD